MEFYLVISCVILYNFPETQSQSPVVSPSPTVYVIEGNNLTVTCTYNATQTIDTLLRLLWRTTGVFSIIRLSKSCQTFGAYKHLATCNRSNMNFYTLKLLLNSSLYSHNDTITCESQHPNDIRISETQVFITVPVKTSDLIQPTGLDVTVIEDLPLEMRCISKGRPQPVIEWYKQKDTGREIPLQGGNNTQTNDLTTQSIISFYPSRRDIGYKVYCKSYNIDQQSTAVSLHKSLLDVFYPLTTPILTYFSETSHTITTDTIDVISGDTFSIGCYADGNPLPAYYWNKQPQANSKFTIDDIQPDDSYMHTCRASNVMDPTYGLNVTSSTTANILLNVMHEPSLPILYYEHEHIRKRISTSSIQVIEHTTFTVKCDSSIGNPPDVTYHWQGNVGKNFTIRDIKRNQSGTYTCNVTNAMQRTFGADIIGHTSRLLTVDVLYPLSVPIIADMEREEGSNVNVACNIVKGNPESAHFRWSHGLTYISSTPTLEINNISRNHSGIYDCEAYNVLQPTFGRVENGSDSESFHLDVRYKSSIKEFYARIDSHTYTNITLDELDPLNIYCSVDSNPNSNIDIQLNGQQIVMQTNVENINHVVESAACNDAGIYTCTGYNPHIQDQRRDKDDIIVYVRCYPRATKPVKNITAADQNDTVHFNATFMAYPVPGDEGYIWQKQQSDSSWLVLESNDRINISTGNLQSELTVQRIRQSDYGNYSLTLSNNVGKEYGQIFKLVPHEAPGVPENVQVMILKNKDVLCSWRQGFNGGYKQTFVIQLSTDKRCWYNITFDLRRNDTSQQCWTILNGTDFDMTYYIRIYSFNILGRSDIVIGHDLKFVIKSDRVSPTSPSTNKAAIVGGTVGGILVVVIVLIAVVIVRRKATPGLWIFCKKKPTKADNVYYNTAHTRNEVIEDSFRTERRTRPAIIETPSSTDEVNTYEHMIATNPEEKVYSELKHDGADGTDHDVQAEQSNIYINLRINGTHGIAN